MISVSLLLSILFIAVTATGSDENYCTIEENTVICSEPFKFPLELEEDHFTMLIVHSKQVHRIEKIDVEQFPNLQILDFSNCAIEHIDSDAFINNTKLQELNLSGNKDLKFPENGSLIQSESLTKLNLSDTSILELAGNAFEGSPMLVDIDLSSNELERLDSTPFLVTKDLVTLRISKDDNIDKRALCSETNLEEIYLYVDENQMDEKYECKSDDEQFIETSAETMKHEEEEMTTEPEEFTTEELVEETTTTTELWTPTTPAADEEMQEDDVVPDESIVQPFSIGNETKISEETEEDFIDTPPKEIKENMEESLSKGSFGTNVVLGIILCVMVVGAAGFGYKYIKNRKSGYRNTSTDEKELEEEGKELKTIVTYKPKPEQTN